jgi:hypothetical protein
MTIGDGNSVFLDTNVLVYYRVAGHKENVNSDTVYLNDPTGATLSGGWKMKVMTDPREVQTYIKKFEALVVLYGQPLNQVCLSDDEKINR